jgi:hypothetical protein
MKSRVVKGVLIHPIKAISGEFAEMVSLVDLESGPPIRDLTTMIVSRTVERARDFPENSTDRGRSPDTVDGLRTAAFC